MPYSFAFSYKYNLALPRIENSNIFLPAKPLLLLYKGKCTFRGPIALLVKWIQSALSVSLMKFNRGDAARGANDVAKRLIEDYQMLFTLPTRTRDCDF